MDPITLIVTALATGAAAGLKPTAEKAIQEAYEGIKNLIKRKYKRVSVEMLENEPVSKERQKIMKQDLEKTDAGRDEEVLLLAQELLKAIERFDPGSAGAVGVDLKDVEAGASISITDIIASGTGVKAERVKAGGDLKISNVRAGGTGDSKKNP